MTNMPFNWTAFHAYRVFNEFLESLVINRKSYVTNHSEILDLDAAFEEISQRFVVEYDASNATFESKVLRQFEGAKKETKILFTNLEYLWAMPVANITPKTKRSYVERWFGSSELSKYGERYFLQGPHVIANPGSWYLTNKYWEMVAMLRVFNLITKTPDLSDLTAIKERIADICYGAIYRSEASSGDFATRKKCGVYSALMHLAKPEQYESIVSHDHKKRIIAVFGHLVKSPSSDPEANIKQIRKAMYDTYAVENKDFQKYRSFFYCSAVKMLWVDKKTKDQQRTSSALFDVREEEDFEDLEGERGEVTTARIKRSAKLVADVKKRDKYTCQACGFHFKKQIVHVHHLDPISEYEMPRNTSSEDLITLCPNCHYIAHYFLRVDSRYKERDTLLSQLTSSSKSLKGAGFSF